MLKLWTLSLAHKVKFIFFTTTAKRTVLNESICMMSFAQTCLSRFVDTRKKTLFLFCLQNGEKEWKMTNDCRLWFLVNSCFLIINFFTYSPYNLQLNFNTCAIKNMERAKHKRSGLDKQIDCFDRFANWQFKWMHLPSKY